MDGNSNGILNNLGNKEVNGVGIMVADTGVDITVADIGVGITVADIGVGTTVADIGVDTTVADIGVDITVADTGVDTTVADTGAAINERKNRGVAPAARHAAIPHYVLDMIIYSSLNDKKRDA
jgi:hypothetical protein